MADLRAEILPVAIFFTFKSYGEHRKYAISFYFFIFLCRAKARFPKSCGVGVPLGMVPFRADAILQSLMMIEKKYIQLSISGCGQGGSKLGFNLNVN